MTVKARIFHVSLHVTKAWFLTVAVNCFRITFALIFDTLVPIRLTDRQGQKMIANMYLFPIFLYIHFRRTSGKTSTQKLFLENFYCTKSFV